MLLQNNTRRIMRKIAEDTGLSFNQVKDIWTSQFKFLVEEMRKGDKGDVSTFKNIMIRFLGTFEASKGKIYYMTRNSEKKKAKEAKQCET